VLSIAFALRPTLPFARRRQVSAFSSPLAMVLWRAAQCDTVIDISGS
jgi:hypothetical protein